MLRLIYRIALATCPRDVRRRFGARMRSDFEELLAGASTARARWRLTAREAIDVMRAGWSARRRRSDFRPGTFSKPRVRERLTLILDDVRFAFRSLAARRGYAFVSVATLALGIGAGTIVFSVIDNVVIKPLPYPEADRLTWVWAADLTRGPDSRMPVTAGEFHDWRRMSGSFDRMIASRARGFVLGGGDYLERVVASEVTDGAFEMFGAVPILGGSLDASSAEDEVVLSHGTWQQLFGADPGVIGRRILLGGEGHTVVGVMPAGFRFPFTTYASMWRPLRFDPDGASDRSRRQLTVIGRLGRGVSRTQAADEMGTIAAALAGNYPDNGESWGVNVLGLKDVYLQDSRSVYLILAAAVVLVLLITSANLASLVLARGAARQAEIAVRVALGAGRVRLVRLLVAEGFLVAALGTLAGAVVAVWGLSAVLPLAPSWPLPLRESTITARSLAFAAAAGALSLLLFSLLPAIGMTRPRLRGALGGASWATGGSARAMRFRRALVVGQVGLAIVLMIGAGLLVRSVVNILTSDTGFDYRGVVAARVTTEAEGDAACAYFDELVERAASLPGVTSVGLVDSVPMDGTGDWVRVFIDGRRVRAERALGADYRRVSPGYFETLRIDRVAGRLLSDTDGADEPVAVISEDFARRYLAGREPIGTLVSVAPSFGGDATDQLRELRVVGVVRTVEEWGPASFEVPMIYVPFAADPYRSMSLLLRTDASPEQLIDPLRSIVREVGDNPVDQVRTLASYFAESYENQRFLLALLLMFAGLAVVLAVVGLYGVIAYHVAQRHREIGVRVALGADGSSIVGMFVRQGAVLALLATVIGFIGAIPLARGLSESLTGMMLVDVQWFDPFAFGAVPAMVLAIAMMASWLPARKAARVDPVEALRSDA